MFAHAICPTAFDPLQAPKPKHAASLFMPVPFQLRGKQPEDWVKLKNGFMESVLNIWRRYATNLTDDNIEMKVAMDPFYISGRWPNMRRGSVWRARLANRWESTGRWKSSRVIERPLKDSIRSGSPRILRTPSLPDPDAIAGK